ncbi:hypothetical protein Tco_0976218 [Tanacetum coccineum]|uniref:Uncharacterized protein n=1 Tax=Tanacetum coccineum TaxID=301880 RepID=A0ABQ5EGR1_9ASTR
MQELEEDKGVLVNLALGAKVQRIENEAKTQPRVATWCHMAVCPVDPPVDWRSTTVDQWCSDDGPAMVNGGSPLPRGTTQEVTRGHLMIEMSDGRSEVLFIGGSKFRGFSTRFRADGSVRGGPRYCSTSVRGDNTRQYEVAVQLLTAGQSE